MGTVRPLRAGHRPLRTLAAALVLALPAPALAERSDAFLELANRLPLDAFEAEAGVLVHFADTQAAERTLEPLPDGVDAGTVARFGAWSRVQSPAFVGSLQAGLDGGWQPLVGFGAADVAQHLLVAAPPRRGLLIRLGDGADPADVTTALRANGYAPTTRDGLEELARGEEDHAMDLARRNPADPFGGDLGLASRVVVDGPLVIQSSEWPLLGQLAEGAADHPDLAALAGAIDRPDWGDAPLVQAALWLRQDEFPAGAGLPPWRLAALADLGDAAGTVTLALFSYPTRAEAEAAVAHLSAAWPGATGATGQPLALATGAAAEALVTGDGPFVAALALRAPPAASAGWPVNRPFQVLYQEWLRRGLALFGPA